MKNKSVLALQIFSLFVGIQISSPARAEVLCRDLFSADLNASLTLETPEAKNFITQVISVEKISDSTGLIRLTKPQGFNFKAGQAVSISINTPDGIQNRFMSIANSPNQNYLEFAMRYSESAFKTVLLSLKSGDAVSIGAPLGHLNFNPVQPAIMIAGGIGITPFRSIWQDPKSQNTQMTLFYSNRSSTDVPFQNEIDQLAKTQSNFHVNYIVNEAPNGGPYIIGTIDKAYLSDVISHSPSNAIYYVVGSPPMVTAIKAELAELGIPADRISADM